MLKKIFNKYLNIVFHLGFWILSFKVLYDLFKEGDSISKADLIYTSVFLITIMLPVYLNLRLLIPKLFSRNKYMGYGISFNHLTFNRLVDYVFPDYYFISYYELVDLAKFITVFLILTSLLKLSKSWFLVNEAEKKLALAEKEKINSELLALKSQINPHFLFNSLNNIYSLALKSSDSTPGAIIKLGNLLRYIIYRGPEEKVKLGDEIDILNQFIELQKLRSKKADILFNTEIYNNDVKISPLIFLPLIENGFKHGVKSDTNGTFLHIRIRSSEDKIVFSAENNKGKVDNTDDEKHKGIGLDNVKRRLEISYPGKHEFSIFDREELFKVELIIYFHE